MLAVGARLVRELGELMAGGLRAGKPLATFTIDSEITFASAADRAAFADDLAGAVSSLAARYHTEGARRAPPSAGGSPAPQPDHTMERTHHEPRVRDQA
jgi:hypothetical protein